MALDADQLHLTLSNFNMRVLDAVFSRLLASRTAVSFEDCMAVERSTLEEIHQAVIAVLPPALERAPGALIVDAAPPDQNTIDWNVVREAVYEAQGEGGGISEQALQRAFKRAGIVVLKDGP